MRSRSVRILAVLVVILFGVLYALSTTDRDVPDTDSDLLIPEFKARLNDITSVTITNEDGPLTIERADAGWRVREKHGYPADTAKLRQLLIAIAEARKVEQKTANAALYDKLGVQAVDDGGDGVLVAAKGADFGFSVILGNTAQGDYRYARIPDEAESWLIDRSPELPDTASGWLESEVLDVKMAEVRSVEIRHADGETIRLLKESAEAATFEVEGIPAGRELSYPTIANSIAGALGNLTFEDVAPAKQDGWSDATEVHFLTFDGLRIDISTGTVDDETWLALEASVEPATIESTVADTPEAESDDAGASATPETGNGTEPGDAEPAGQPTPAARAATINERTAGWRYRIPGYKAEQLTRRWADLLKAEDDTE